MWRIRGCVYRGRLQRTLEREGFGSLCYRIGRGSIEIREILRLLLWKYRKQVVFRIMSDILPDWTVSWLLWKDSNRKVDVDSFRAAHLTGFFSLDISIYSISIGGLQKQTFSCSFFVNSTNSTIHSMLSSCSAKIAAVNYSSLSGNCSAFVKWFIRQWIHQ